MEELRQEFLQEAIPKLKILLTRLDAKEFSEEFEREIFRILHTLKGTSQTFNLNISGRLAHEIENLFQAKRDKRISLDEIFLELLKEGIKLLLETFQNANDGKEIVSPKNYIEKIHLLIPEYSTAPSENFLSQIPLNYLSQLSTQEKESLSAALANGNLFYLIEVGFNFADFAQKFRELRETLVKHGEIAANFPSPKFALENKIGFQIFFISRKNKDEILNAVKPFGAQLLFQNTESNFSNDLKGVLAQAILTGEKTAQTLGKQVEFKVESSEIEIAKERLKLFSEILLHLVRNAVDHAIETSGKVKIAISQSKNRLLLRVSDDGRGIDIEKVRAKAIIKNLISADEELEKDQILNLIFSHGFSTSDTISEISGRGVGLDVIKDTIENEGGEVHVESEPGKGTIFEISLLQGESKEDRKER